MTTLKANISKVFDNHVYDDERLVSKYDKINLADDEEEDLDFPVMENEEMWSQRVIDEDRNDTKK